jgi:hypothetical protein
MSLSRSSGLRTQLRDRKCTVCAEQFKQARPMQSVCSPACAVVQGRQDTAKKAVKEAKVKAAADRKSLREFRAANKKKGEYLSEAQAAFNAYIRFRDRDFACICCGSFDARNAGGVGGGWDAGHWISRGHASHLRFDERNVHKQRKGCNRPGGTTRAKYRLGLVERIGEAAVIELEALEYALVEVTKTYRAKLRELKDAA